MEYTESKSFLFCIFILLSLTFFISTLSTTEMLYYTWNDIQPCSASELGTNEIFVDWYEITNSTTNQPMKTANWTILIPMDDTFMVEFVAYIVNAKAGTERYFAKFRFPRACTDIKNFKNYFNGNKFGVNIGDVCPIPKGSYRIRTWILGQLRPAPGIMPSVVPFRGDFRVATYIVHTVPRRKMVGCFNLYFNLSSRFT